MDSDYNLDMDETRRLAKILEEISRKLDTLGRIENKLDKIEGNLGRIEVSLDKIEENTRLTFYAILTAKAELTEKGLLDAFRLYLKKRGFTYVRVVEADLYDDGKEDFVIIAEVVARNGTQIYKYSLEVTNYVEVGEVLEQKLNKLLDRAREKGTIPVLGARFMTREAIEEALKRGVKVFTYDPEKRRLELFE